MKEIKNKIKDSIFGDFNQELIGDKLTLQNKVNKLQRMIDMINYLQPNEDTEVDDFVFPELYTVKVTNNDEFLYVLDHLHKGDEKFYRNAFKNYADNDVYYIGINNEGWFYNYKNNHTQNPEITFEQFKKYVLNK